MPTSPLDHLALLIDAQDEFLATINEVDPATPVPWCGTWQVDDLVVHLAKIHHWAAAQARSTDATRLGRGPFVQTDLYRECARELRDTLTELGPDTVGSTLVGQGPASFWRRRQLHETLVHLWDLRTAGGRGLEVPAAVWADVVDEVVTVMQPRQVRLGRMLPLPSTIELTASDVGRTWLLDAAVAGPAVAQLRAPAEVLALILWGRASLDRSDVEVSGDVDLLRTALSEPLTP
ncbi:maleylpyruvate isomerase family mycothiol-dependent enzyme [Pengzhenrongella phosphoraccumulans]|uniref:maleylpyruvate isomerase family mycothiol-dependent enzyme n=1 Tax=Pengzhenrongella phosphoraccumulans TaxID=3114394 RepID=UPI00388D7A38